MTARENVRNDETKRRDDACKKKKRRQKRYTVLLPFDGDGELDEVQKRRLRDAKAALDARYPERPADIDPEYEDGDEAFEYSAANVPGEDDDEDDTDTDDDTDDDDDDDER